MSCTIHGYVSHILTPFFLIISYVLEKVKGNGKKWKIEARSHKKTSKGDEEIFLWRFLTAYFFFFIVSQ